MSQEGEQLIGGYNGGGREENEGVFTTGGGEVITIKKMTIEELRELEAALKRRREELLFGRLIDEQEE